MRKAIQQPPSNPYLELRKQAQHRVKALIETKNATLSYIKMDIAERFGFGGKFVKDYLDLLEENNIIYFDADFVLYTDNQKKEEEKEVTNKLKELTENGTN